MIIKLFRPTRLHTEEYGRVIFDGRNVTFEGLSDVFIKYLEQGVSGADGKKYKPSDGIHFMETLKSGFWDLTAHESQ